MARICKGETPLSRSAESAACANKRPSRTSSSVMRDSGVSPLHIRAIGSHGQTIYHRPHGDAPPTLQIGDPNIIAEHTGITSVADFRRRDIAAGGQGALLVPAFHHAVFHCPTEDRVVINIGGIANITALPREPTAPVRGFDSGPGNVLMDYWIHRHQGAAYDRDGAWAASGRAHPDLLTALLSDGYFARPPPKSTGREYFNPAWLDQILRHYASGLAPADVQATLCELTVASLARAIDEHAAPGMRVLVCGGGALIVYLLTRLRARVLPGVVHSTEPFGVAPQWVESLA